MYSFMIKKIINRYRALKRSEYLKQSSESKYKYAIIGAGEHATTQLYPCIWHIGIPISLICTNTISNAHHAACRFTECRGTINLDDIINDSSIKGVFVSIPPSNQASLVKQLLYANKAVYVEKPLGYSTSELLSVLPTPLNSTLHVGFQRRYAPIGQLTKKLIKSPISYQYHYRIGPYPEGNALYEVFTHQLDYCLFLFGSAKLIHVSKFTGSSGDTYYIELDHNGIKGSIELSTQYSWNNSEEKLEINQEHSSIVSNYPSILEKTKKPYRLFGVPLEKAIEHPGERSIYMSANNSIPSRQNSSANLLGFYPSIYTFFNSVEKNIKTDENIQQTIELYRLLDQVQNA